MSSSKLKFALLITGILCVVFFSTTVYLVFKDCKLPFFTESSENLENYPQATISENQPKTVSQRSDPKSINEQQPSVAIPENAKEEFSNDRIQNVYVNKGNLFLSDNLNNSKQITFAGIDSKPYLSADKKKVVFLRDYGDSNTKGKLNQIWIISTESLREKCLLRAGKIYIKNAIISKGYSNTFGNEIGEIEQVIYSLDGQTIYFLSRAWNKSAALFSFDIQNNTLRFLSGCSYLAIIDKGQYKDKLIIRKHRYNDKGGSYHFYYIIDQHNGQEVKAIGDKLNIGENEKSSPHSSYAKSDDQDEVRFENIKAAAEKGDAAAQYHLGLIYDTGHGVKQDHAEALKWYRKSAEQGNAQAQWSLGGAYRCGYGVNKDNSEAVKWYLKAANQNDERAQADLGSLYLTLDVTQTKNFDEAAKWYAKAAQHRSSEKASHEFHWLSAKVMALWTALKLNVNLHDLNQRRNEIHKWIRKRPSPRIGMKTVEASTTNWGREAKRNTTATATGVEEQWVFGDPDWCLYLHDPDYPIQPRFLYFHDGVLIRIQESR